jgi:transcriptional regulator with XRE-family HTH domain
MSSLFTASLSHSPRALSRRRAWAEFFGGMIQSAREDKGFSLGETASRAGMTAAEWETMEEGQVPETREQLAAIAQALDADLDAIVALAVLCRQAWGR